MRQQDVLLGVSWEVLEKMLEEGKPLSKATRTGDMGQRRYPAKEGIMFSPED